MRPAPGGGRLRRDTTPPRTQADLCWYAFRLTDGDGASGLARQKRPCRTRRRQLTRWQLTVYEEHAPRRSGSAEGVTYQIFPDRFRRVAVPDVSRHGGDGAGSTQSWGDRPVFLPDETTARCTNRDFFGGSSGGHHARSWTICAALGVTTPVL